MMARNKCYLDPLINLKKNVVKVGPPLKKLSGSVHEADKNKRYLANDIQALRL